MVGRTDFNMPLPHPILIVKLHAVWFLCVIVWHTRSKQPEIGIISTVTVYGLALLG